ncbi:MAG: hypothetical protein AB7O88_22945 [Reyranellaceae bacterium]
MPTLPHSRTMLRKIVLAAFIAAWSATAMAKEVGRLGVPGAPSRMLWIDNKYLTFQVGRPVSQAFWEVGTGRTIEQRQVTVRCVDVVSGRVAVVPSNGVDTRSSQIADAVGALEKFLGRSIDVRSFGNRLEVFGCNDYRPFAAHQYERGNLQRLRPGHGIAIDLKSRAGLAVEVEREIGQPKAYLETNYFVPSLVGVQYLPWSDSYFFPPEFASNNAYFIDKAEPSLERLEQGWRRTDCLAGQIWNAPGERGAVSPLRATCLRFVPFTRRVLQVRCGYLHLTAFTDSARQHHAGAVLVAAGAAPQEILAISGGPPGTAPADISPDGRIVAIASQTKDTGGAAQFAVVAAQVCD